MATHSSTLAWQIPWTEEPDRLQSIGSLRVWHDWVTSLSLFTFMHWRRKWQPTPVFLPGESQGWGSLVGCRLWGCTVGDNWSDLAVKNPPAMWETWVWSWVGKSPWRRETLPTPVFCPGEIHGLVWGCKQSDTTERISLSLAFNAIVCVDHKKWWKVLHEMEIPDCLACLLSNLYAGQEAKVRTGHGTMDWFQTRKGVHQDSILSPCLFNLYSEYIMRNAGLEEAQAGIKIAGRNINNLR